MQPGPRVRPVALRGRARDPQCACGLLQRQPGEETEFHHVGPHAASRLHGRERFIERHQLVRALIAADAELVQIEPAPSTALLCGPVLPGPLDEDPAHGLRRGAEEVPPAPPAGLGGADQPQVRLVNERGGLQRQTGLLVPHPLVGQAAQLFVDQRQELPGGLGITLFQARKHFGDGTWCRIHHG